MAEGSLTGDHYFSLQIPVCQAQIRLGDRRGKTFTHPNWAHGSAGTLLIKPQIQPVFQLLPSPGCQVSCHAMKSPRGRHITSAVRTWVGSTARGGSPRGEGVDPPSKLVCAPHETVCTQLRGSSACAVHHRAHEWSLWAQSYRSVPGEQGGVELSHRVHCLPTDQKCLGACVGRTGSTRTGHISQSLHPLLGRAGRAVGLLHPAQGQSPGGARGPGDRAG